MSMTGAKVSLKFPGRQIETAPRPYLDIAYGTNLIKRLLWPPVTMLISSAIGRAAPPPDAGTNEEKKLEAGKKGHAKEGLAG